MIPSSRCVYCQSQSFGKGCSYGPNGIHCHPGDEKRCSYCGSTNFGTGCTIAPGGVHVHGYIASGWPDKSASPSSMNSQNSKQNEPSPKADSFDSKSTAEGIVFLIGLTIFLSPGIGIDMLFSRLRDQQGKLDFWACLKDPMTWIISVAVWVGLYLLYRKLKNNARRNKIERAMGTTGCEKLSGILEKLGLQENMESFLGQGISDSILPHVTDQDLQSMGIKRRGDRILLLQQFQSTESQSAFQK